MPDFWQFPTVSMGLGPLMAIYQARFMKYLTGPRRSATPPGARCGRSWATARWTSPSRWARSRSPAASTSTTSSSSSTATCSASTGRCAATARSSRSSRRTSAAPGWNVIKVIWGNRWDPLLAADTRRPPRAADGGGASTATTRPTSRATARTCASTSSAPTPSSRDDGRGQVRRRDLAAQPRRPRPAEGLRRVRRGGRAHTGQPTVILAKTIKGYGMGESGEGQNITHQQKKMNEKALFAFRDRFDLDLTDDEVKRRSRSTSRADDSPEMQLPARAPRGARRHRCPQRRTEAPPLPVPELSAFKAPARGHGRARDLDDDGVRPDPRRRSCATRSSARTSSRSSPTSRGRSAWRGCSASSGSSARSASSTRPRTPTSSCSTARTRRARSSRRASTSRARSRRGSPRRRRTPTTASR